jgi:ABC-type multidrug transport system permease subunit
VVFLMALLFSYLGHCLASALPNMALAATVQGAVVSIFFLFAGVYIRRENMPRKKFAHIRTAHVWGRRPLQF